MPYQTLFFVQEKFNKKNSFLLVFLVATVLSFVKLGDGSINDWDEARNGVNAFEMLQTHDYVTLYYNQQPDTWNNKPPLLIWLIALSYKVFGFNEFALRFPSALAAVIFFLFFYKLITLYESPLFALMACTILFSSKAIIGQHVGRTGDFDALLICFLTIAAYYFIKYIHFYKERAIYISAIFMGLAFYTKGTASLCIIPGFILFLICEKKFVALFTKKEIIRSIIIYLLFVGSWIYCISALGKVYSSSSYGSHNAIETLFVHDTFERLTDSSFDSIKKHDWFYFVRTIDTKLNLWNYLFYSTILILLLKYCNVGIGKASGIITIKNKLLFISLMQVLTLCTILSFAASKNPWYLAPVLPFVVIVITYGIKYFYNSFPVFKPILFFLILFTFSRHFIYLYQPSQNLKNFFLKNNSVIKKYKKIYLIDQPPQAFLLYLNWNFEQVIHYDLKTQTTDISSMYYLNGKNTFIKNFNEVDHFNEFLLATLKTK